MDVVSLLLGFVVGAALVGVYARTAHGDLATAKSELLVSQGRIVQLEKHNADLTAQQQQHTELGVLLKPVTEGLAQVSRAAADADRRRVEAETSIKTLIQDSKSVNDSLNTGVQQLVSAMSKGQDRGKWGEMQLEQLLSHSGLVEGMNYRLQDSRDEGALRPDLVVMLPGGGEVLVDSKFPWDAYFAAMGTDDAAQKLSLLQKHAKDLGQRVSELSRKQYAASSAVTPDFVVLFLPLEPLLSTALDHDGMLLEAAFSKNIIMATPTTMLGLLRTIHFAWSRHDLAVNAEEIREVGAELLARLGKMVEHFNAHGKSLRRAIDSYNDMLSSFDTRVIKQADRMKSLGVRAAKSMELTGEIANDVHNSRTEPELGPADARTLAP
jgi:DNA recombination protein RmuC